MPSVAQIIRRRRNRKVRQQREKTRSQLWSALVFGGTALAVLGPLLGVLGFAGFLYVRAIAHMPSPADTVYLDPIVAETNFYDNTGGTLIYSVQDPLGDDREWMTLEILPEHLLNATIQMEDPDYLDAGGFNAGRIINQLWRYGLGLPVTRESSLASRLAQQTLVPPARSSNLDPALLQVVFTAEVQRQLTPRRVLEWYLNTAYYGNDAYGIDAAAQVYFGKSAVDLTLDEAALLAAIPLAPQFNPIDNELAARDRQINLLRDMRGAGYITDDEFEIIGAVQTPIRTDLAQPPFVASEFSVYAREQAEEILNTLDLDGARLVSRGGLQITTTLDLELYYQAECTLRAHLTQLEGNTTSNTLTLSAQPCIGTNYLSNVISTNPNSLPNQGEIVIHDVQTGRVLAMVGNTTDYTYQPGPTLYPFVYLTGFFSGNYTTARMVLDIPTQFPGTTEGSIFAPINADGNYRGPMNLRDAMASGLRTPAIAVANREGLTSILETTRIFGLNNLADISNYDLSVIDTGGNVSVLDMTYIYSVFASGGDLRGVELPPVARGYRSLNPVFITQIADAEGNILWQYNADSIAVSSSPIVDDEFAYIVNDVLSDSGTRQAVLNINDEVLNIGRPVGVSNGMTSDRTDSWTIGYTPQLVVSVHVGREDDESMTLDNYGLQGSAPIWQAVSQYAHERYNYLPATWSRPSDIIELQVCDISGLLPPEDSQCEQHSEIFFAQSLPAQEDIYWQTVPVNSQTGQRASSTTPDYLVVNQLYFIPPSDALEWWQTNNLPLPPTEYDALSLPQVLGGTNIFEPQDLAYVSGVVDVLGVVNTDDLQSYQVRYGAGFRPSEWITVGGTQTTFTEGISLAEWDTVGLDGPYTVQISVLNNDGTVSSSGVRVTIDNEAPTLELTTGEAGETLFRFPTTTVIPLVTNADDNLAIDRVEFYNNGLLLGTVEQAPYEWIYTIERTGIENFSATVFDEAGNQSTSDLEVEVIRGS